MALVGVVGVASGGMVAGVAWGVVRRYGGVVAVVAARCMDVVAVEVPIVDEEACEVVDRSSVVALRKGEEVLEGMRP